MVCNKNCKHCPNFVKSEALTLTGSTLYITLPNQTYYNNEVYCVAITQNIPTGVTSSTPLNITINGVNYTIVTTDGHFMYADQLVCRRVFRFKVAADSKLFIINSCNLKCSNTFLPETLEPITTNTINTVNIRATTVEKGVK